jgi:hypothetical protein
MSNIAAGKQWHLGIKWKKIHHSRIGQSSTPGRIVPRKSRKTSRPGPWFHTWLSNHCLFASVWHSVGSHTLPLVPYRQCRCSRLVSVIRKIRYEYDLLIFLHSVTCTVQRQDVLQKGGHSSMLVREKVPIRLERGHSARQELFDRGEYTHLGKGLTKCWKSLFSNVSMMFYTNGPTKLGIIVADKFVLVELVREKGRV